MPWTWNVRRSVPRGLSILCTWSVPFPATGWPCFGSWGPGWGGCGSRGWCQWWGGEGLLGLFLFGWWSLRRRSSCAIRCRSNGFGVCCQAFDGKLFSHGQESVEGILGNIHLNQYWTWIIFQIDGNLWKTNKTSTNYQSVGHRNTKMFKLILRSNCVLRNRTIF